MVGDFNEAGGDKRKKKWGDAHRHNFLDDELYYLITVMIKGKLEVVFFENALEFIFFLLKDIIKALKI